MSKVLFYKAGTNGKNWDFYREQSLAGFGTFLDENGKPMTQLPVRDGLAVGDLLISMAGSRKAAQVLGVGIVTSLPLPESERTEVANEISKPRKNALEQHVHFVRVHWYEMRPALEWSSIQVVGDLPMGDIYTIKGVEKNTVRSVRCLAESLPGEFGEKLREALDSVELRPGYLSLIRDVLAVAGTPLLPKVIGERLQALGYKVVNGGSTVRTVLQQHSVHQLNETRRFVPYIFLSHGDGRWSLAAERTNGVQAALKWPVPPHCVVLEGVPGTGKTYRLKDVRDAAALDGSTIVGDGSGRFAVTLHPATAYEDFVEGLRPAKVVANKSSKAGAQGCQVGEFRKRDDKSEEKKFVLDDRTFFFSKPAAAETSRGAFTLQDGFFVSICIEAGLNPTKEFVVLLDELNRCNIPKVLGDLLTTLESSKRARWCSKENSKEKATARCWDASVDDGFWDITDAQVVTLPYSRRLFFVPDNVYVIATMNTTDRSVAPMDAALRRRFAFERVWPIGFEPSAVCKAEREGSDEERGAAATKRRRDAMLFALKCPLEHPILPSVEAWIAMNTKLQKFGYDAMLGHSYLFDLVRDLKDSDRLAVSDVAVPNVIAHHWNKHIFPQLVDSLLTNDLLDSVFNDEGERDTQNNCAGGILSTLGLGSKAASKKGPPHRIGDLILAWELRGTGLMRVPTITVSVKDEASVEQVETKTGNEAGA